MYTMKTYIFILCSIIVTAGFACNKALEPSGEGEALKSLQQQYAKVGQQHNASLDHVLDGFNELSAKDRRLSRSELVQFAIDRNRNYVTSQYQSPDLKQRAGEAIDAELNRMFKPSLDKSALTGVNQNDTFAGRLDDPAIQSTEKKYFQRIGEVVETSENQDQVESRIQEVLEEAQSELEEEKLTALVIAGEVAVASSGYWIENREEWIGKIHQLQEESGTQAIPTPSVKFMPWRPIAKADVQSAVTGAMASLITGCGQMTVGACTGAGALGGGAVGSVGAMVGAVIDEFLITNPVDYPELNQE